MTLRNSIMFSLAAHLLLFGTGLAFARFGAQLFPSPQEAVIVSLVGKGGSSTVGGQQRKTSPAARIRPVVQERLPQVPDQPFQKAPAIGDPSLQSDGDRSGQQPKAAVPGGETGSSVESGQTAGNQSGTVSSEQWAAIVSSIERVKNYPRMARERGIEGTVHIRFRLKPQGEVDRVEIVKSSGFDILDDASVRTVYRAGPMPFVTGWIEVPIAYVLK